MQPVGRGDLFEFSQAMRTTAERGEAQQKLIWSRHTPVMQKIREPIVVNH